VLRTAISPLSQAREAGFEAHLVKPANVDERSGCSRAIDSRGEPH
jgi:hypothetical protein